MAIEAIEWAIVYTWVKSILEEVWGTTVDFAFEISAIECKKHN